MERERKKSKQSAGEGMYCRGDDQADLRKAAFGDHDLGADRKSGCVAYDLLSELWFEGRCLEG